MSKRTFELFSAFLFLILFSTLLFSRVCGSETIKSDAGQSGPLTERQFSENLLNVDMWVLLSEHYGLWDLEVSHYVQVNLTVSLQENALTGHNVSLTHIPFSLEEISGLPPGASYTYGFWGFPPIGVLKIYFPANTSNVSILLQGHFTSSSVLWRNSAEIFYFNITSSLDIPHNYRVILVPPSNVKVLRLYSHAYPNLPFQQEVMDGKKVFLVSSSYQLPPIVILYEPDVWESYAIALLLLIILSFFMVPYILKLKQKASSTVSKFLAIFKRVNIKILVHFLKRLHKGVKELNASKLLHVYVLCALLMISLSFAVGPDPRLKVYVLSSTSQNAKLISNFINERGGFSITVFDEMTEFELLSDLGIFSAVVVGEFYPPSEDLVKRFIYPALDVIPNIIVLRNYAFDFFIDEINTRYNEKTIIVEDLNGLSSVLRTTIPRRTNALGLNIVPEVYEGVASFVGLCSFLIVFIGFAFLSSKLIEVGKKPGAGGFIEGITYAFFIFFFTQTVYIVCSVLLAMPLGLHTGSPKVTAVGFMGFGGGSRPRMLAGLIGFLFGGYVSFKEGLKISREGLAAFFVLSLFILIDPLTQGIIFYEFVLLYTVGPMVETAFTTWTYVREILGFIGASFGGDITSIYTISRGVILYYAGAIPTILFSKFQKGTATLSLLLCAFWAASGGIRVADMMPWKAVASSIPGIMAGLFFSVLFLLISYAESAVRAKIGRTR